MISKFLFWTALNFSNHSNVLRTLKYLKFAVFLKFIQLRYNNITRKKNVTLHKKAFEKKEKSLHYLKKINKVMAHCFPNFYCFTHSAVEIIWVK